MISQFFLDNMKTKLILLLSLILLIILILGWVLWDDIRGIKYAPQVLYTELDFNNYGYRNTLLIRKESLVSRNILMKMSDGNGVYIYDGATQRFSYKDGKTWDEAQGVIKVCDPKLISPVGAPRQAYGKYKLNSEYDSTSTKNAIITTNGFKIPAFGVLPNLGGNGRITGIRYFEVLTKEGEKISKTMRVQKLEMTSPYLCWSQDNDFVIISDSGYSTLAVAEIAEIEKN
jgi:hypothetical protein